MKSFIFGLSIFFVGLLAMTSCNNSKNKFNKVDTAYQAIANETTPLNWIDLKALSEVHMRDHNYIYTNDSLYVPYSYNFASFYTKGNKQLSFEVNLFFISNTADNMVGVYSLHIPHDESFYKKYPEIKFNAKLKEYQCDTFIDNFAVGIFRIEKDSLFLEQSLAWHYQDSLCAKLPALDTCICNCANTQTDLCYEGLNQPHDMTNRPIFEVPITPPENFEVPFGLEIEPIKFSIQTTIKNKKVKDILGDKYTSKLEFGYPIVMLSPQENLKISRWASPKEIRKKYPKNSPKKNLHYPLFQKKELALSNTCTFLTNIHEFSFYSTREKYISFLTELTNKNDYEFGRCRAVDIVDIYELLLDYTRKERLKRDKK